VGEGLAFELLQLGLRFVLSASQHEGEEVAAGVCSIGAQPFQIATSLASTSCFSSSV